MRKPLACLVLLQATATCLVWAFPSHTLPTQDASEDRWSLRRQVFHFGALPKRQDQISASTVAMTVPRILYPTGFDGFPADSTVTTVAPEDSTAATGVGPRSTSPVIPASTGSNSDASTFMPPSTSPDASQRSASNDTGNDGTTLAIAIVVPIALGTILTLAFGGALMMWCKSKPPNEDDEHDNPFEIVKENP
ncbi:hypothetical protein CALVIDRAFT_554669 [Calocera viscosa TUFC12733]|uniref:Mid2 domain-containing protein n=1 Tax=Calocera viscosa (strain TUFC12733) TaxID=1330018 RepID=A0A167MSI9_CALVF|nr:hypothetical protein CALVIDRAFT_554669 [Calocera viscosa TUFC12733]